MQNTIKSVDQNYVLWKGVFLTSTLSLIGEITKSMRGITLNFDGEIIEITVFFEREPSKLEIEIIQNVEAEIISHHDYQSNLVAIVSPITENLVGKGRNWGWIYLRRED